MLRRSKIILSTSISETFHSAVAEALVLGNTLVGPPIRSYFLFSLGGLSGLVARRFGFMELFGKMVQEMILHESGLRTCEKISDFWKSILKPKNSVKGFLEWLNRGGVT